MQWFWDAPEIKQTYESCIDFKIAAVDVAAPAASLLVAPASSAALPATPVQNSTSGKNGQAYGIGVGATCAINVNQKREVMESMTNGPKIALGVTTMPMSLDSITASCATSQQIGTSSASQSSPMTIGEFSSLI